MRHTTLLILVSVLIAHPTPAQSDRYGFPLDMRVALPVASAASLLKQCSRAAPQSVDAFWVPTDDQLAKLESGLVAYLEAAARKIAPPAGHYHRQYIGFTQSGQRFIYGNFYPGRLALTDSERTQAVVVCDGGSSFWGVVYDPENDTFLNLAFNGVG